jgi:hypothetical protein
MTELKSLKESQETLENQGFSDGSSGERRLAVSIRVYYTRVE